MTTLLKKVLIVTALCSAVALAMEAMAPKKPAPTTKSISIGSIKNLSGQDAYMLYYYTRGVGYGGETLEEPVYFEEKEFFPLDKAFYIRRDAKINLKKSPGKGKMTVSVLDPGEPFPGEAARVKLIFVTKKGNQQIVAKSYDEILIKKDGSIDPHD